MYVDNWYHVADIIKALKRLVEEKASLSKRGIKNSAFLS